MKQEEEFLKQKREEYITGLLCNEYHNQCCPSCGGKSWAKEGPMGPQDGWYALIKVRCTKCNSLYVTYVPIH